MEKIRKNQFRIAALVLFSLAAIFFILTDGEEEKIDLNETSQVEQIEEQNLFFMDISSKLPDFLCVDGSFSRRLFYA